VAESEQLTPGDEIGERIVFGLRLTDGVSLEETGALVFSRFTGKVNELVAESILERNGTRVRLTSRGRRYADTVAVALLASLNTGRTSPFPLTSNPGRGETDYLNGGSSYASQYGPQQTSAASNARTSRRSGD
jgi:oxygen-independent coproporphyrinogen III oxidase